jgi:DNA-binding NtrC family response regulator
MARILLVDDDANVLRAVRRALAYADPVLRTISMPIYEDPKKALEFARDHYVDLAIADYHMPGMNGVAFLCALRELQPDAGRVLLTATTDFDALVGAVNEAGVMRFLRKPWHETELVSAVMEILEHRDLLLENRRLADQVRVQQGVISKQEMELRRLEEEAPGITRVKWGPDGSVLLDED